jgi:four helix bundle suffix protein
MQKHPVDKSFLRQGKDYSTLICYKKAVIIYDITYYFAHKFLDRGDRTVDQMVQAARSGKQNIVEGNIDGITSTEMEMKLTNVNRASLHELLEDYKDYLRVNGLQQWLLNSPKAEQARRYCATHNDPDDYATQIKERSAETIANIAITLILQTDVMIKGLIEWQKNYFKEHGGIKEQMFNERRKQRGY